MSDSVSSSERSRSRRCSRRNSTCSARRGAFGLGQRVDRADAVAAPLEALEAVAQRAPPRRRPAGGSKAADLERSRRPLRSAPRLRRGAPRGGPRRPGPRLRPSPSSSISRRSADLVFGQARAAAAVARPGLGLARLVAEALDERLDAACSAAAPPRVGAGRGRPRDLRQVGEAALDLGAGGRGALGAALAARALVGGALPRARAARRARCGAG